jgi:hypothetical protein
LVNERGMHAAMCPASAISLCDNVKGTESLQNAQKYCILKLKRFFPFKIGSKVVIIVLPIYNGCTCTCGTLSKLLNHSQ